MTQDEVNDLVGKRDNAASTMLAALIEVANDPNMPADLRGMVFAVIAQAEAAGITAQPEDMSNDLSQQA
jgi:uncharacterized protein (UPF0147 family)